MKVQIKDNMKLSREEKKEIALKQVLGNKGKVHESFSHLMNSPPDPDVIAAMNSILFNKLEHNHLYKHEKAVTVLKRQNTEDAKKILVEYHRQRLKLAEKTIKSDSPYENDVESLRFILEQAMGELGLGETPSLVKEVAMRNQVLSKEADLANQLHQACEQGNLRDLQSVFSQQVDLESRNSEGQTAIMVAAKAGYKEIVSKLMEYGADRNKWGLKARSVLYGKGVALPNAFDSALGMSAEEGHEEIVRLLVETALANVTEGGVSITGEHVALALAGIHGYTDIVKYLLSANIWFDDEYFITSVSHMIEHGSISGVKTALECGVHPNLARLVPDKEFRHRKQTFLSVAAGCQQIEIAHLLIEFGAVQFWNHAKGQPYRGNPNNRGNVPLMNAVYNDVPELTKLFCETESSFDIADNHGNTPLHIATQLGYLEHIEILLAAGARSDLTNRVEQTPLDIALETGNEVVIQLLR